MAVASVVIRLAGTQVVNTHVARGARFTVGPTREADFALDVPTFTLVSSAPHGFTVRRSADADPEPLDGAITIEHGAITITIDLATVAHTPVPRRQIERLPYAFGAASIVVHAGVLLAAVWFAAPDEGEWVPATETAKRRPARIARFAVESQTVKREDKPIPEALPVTTDATPTDAPETDDPSSAAAQTLPSEQPPNGVGEKVAATPQSNENPGDQLSNERRFDPTDDPAFDTVKVGHFSTVSSGKAGGEQFELAGANGKRKPLIVVSCDSSSCVVIGGDSSGVREELQRRLPEIVACYEAHASTAGKKVELDFGIDPDGKVEQVNVGGVGDYDSCVSNIIASIQFGSNGS